MTAENCEGLKNTIKEAYSSSGGLSLGEGIAYCDYCGLEVKVVNNLQGLPSQTSTNGKLEENCILYTDSKENMPGPNKEICPNYLFKEESLRSGLKNTTNQKRRGKCSFCPITIKAKSDSHGNISSETESGNLDTDCTSPHRVPDPR